MISPLSATAAMLAILATASLAFATEGHRDAAAPKAATKNVQLERAVIVAKRLPADAL